MFLKDWQGRNGAFKKNSVYIYTSLGRSVDKDSYYIWVSYALQMRKRTPPWAKFHRWFLLFFLKVKRVQVEPFIIVCVTFEITSEQLLSFRSLLFIYIVASSTFKFIHQYLISLCCYWFSSLKFPHMLELNV